MKEHVVLRVPAEWEHWLNSAHVESFLRDYYVQRPLLPDDPGSDGGGRVSLSLERKPLRVFCALLDQRPSAALRRLIAGHAGVLPDPDIINVLPTALSSTSREIVPARPVRLVRIERAPKPTPWILRGSCPTQYARSYEEFLEWEDRILEVRQRGLPVPSPNVRPNRRFWLVVAVVVGAAVLGAFWFAASRSDTAIALTSGAGLDPWTPEV
jgi:hypothetical protein